MQRGLPHSAGAQIPSCHLLARAEREGRGLRRARIPTTASWRRSWIEVSSPTACNLRSLRSPSVTLTLSITVTSWTGDLSYGMAPGRWILSLVNGRPQRPAFVVRVSDHESFKLVWTRTLTSGPSVRQADLADAMGPAWIQWDEGVEDARVIRGRDRVKAIFDLYRS